LATACATSAVAIAAIALTVAVPSTVALTVPSALPVPSTVAVAPTVPVPVSSAVAIASTIAPTIAIAATIAAVAAAIFGKRFGRYQVNAAASPGELKWRERKRSCGHPNEQLFWKPSGLHVTSRVPHSASLRQP
jgi:hypothetical protein